MIKGTAPGRVLEPLRTLFTSGTAAGLPDGQLLERFASRQDHDAEAAFAALVSRHGPTIRSACRSLLADPNDADDAFQATFLVLARKARMIRRPELLGNWLYGTAHRTARTLKTRAARRLKHEAGEAAMARAGASSDPEEIPNQAIRREQAAVIHEELARLPRACRTVLILCDLEGRPHEQAAHLLRCSDRTLRRRLVRARHLLRVRLTRRGLAPTAALLAAALHPEPASAAISQITVDATARAAIRFATEQTARTVPAAAAALAQGVITVMFRTKLQAIATASVILLAIGVGAGVTLGFAIPRDDKKAESKSAAAEVKKAKELSPAEQFRDLIRRYDLAMAAFDKLGENAKTQAEREAAYKGHHIPEEDFNPQFLALAERYPRDPVAIDALVWIVEKTMRYWDGYNRTQGDTMGRTMEILARDHLADPRLGALCLKLIYYPSPRRDEFLRRIAERSKNRVGRGQATLALAQYLKMKGEFVESLKKPASPQEEKTVLEIYGAEYLGQLRAADPAQMLREADRLFDRVSDDYGDIAYSSPDGKISAETLADLARRVRLRTPPGNSRPSGPDAPADRFRSIDEAFRAGVKAAEEATQKAQKDAGKTQPDLGSVQAYIAAYPKWPDAGRSMWKLAQTYPRHQAAFNALIWLVEQGPRFFDSRQERDAVLSQVVDVLIRDHLETIADHLADRNVAMALSMGETLPAASRERLLRALFERGRDRITRGRMGLALGRYLASLADCVERLTRRGPDSRRPWELLFLDPAVAEELRKADRQAISRQAEEVLNRVIVDFGDVAFLNGQVATTDTLATIAKRELFELQSLSVGCQAPEIAGEDASGARMKLSDFRGKVVLLDFGSHEHCGGCKVVYPRLRATLDRLRGRPFAILGINNFDRRDKLKEAIAHGEITWRCWWDGDKPLAPGPITTSWNIRGYPTFILIDGRGVIRSKKDTHPFDPSFDSSLEMLLKEAESARPGR